MNLIESSDIPPIETPLGDLVEGTLITVQENGAPVEFYVSKQNYEEGLNGAGRVLCVRKDVQSNQAWNSNGGNTYSESSIDSWCNSTYKSTLSNTVQTMIGETSFYYTPGNGNNIVSTLKRAVFLLSVSELGKSETWYNAEGTTLPISANLSGSVSNQWTRSPVINSYNNSAGVLVNNGVLTSYYTSEDYGSRPVFTLPSTALVDGNLALIEEV